MKPRFWIGGALMVVTGIPLYIAQAAPSLDANCVGSISAPTVIRAGARFNATATIKNNGLNTWTRNQLFYLGSQDPQDNNLWGIGRVALPAESVPAKKTVTFTISATAPKQTGTYSFVWQMLQEKRVWFGQKCKTNKQITVIAALTTPTPTPTPTSTNKPIPDVATQVVCPVITTIVRAPGQQLVATLRSTSGAPLSGLPVVWASKRNLITPISSVTNASGQASTMYVLPFDAGVRGDDQVTATFKEGTIGGVHYFGSSCNFTFTFDSPKIPTPTPTSSFLPIPTVTATPIVTPYPSTPTPIVTPVITINPYDPVTPQPNPYTNASTLTATITSPVAKTSILKGQLLRVAILGKGSPTCGTWKLVKPNGQTVVLTASDFASGQLPGGIAPCTPSAY